MTSETFIITYWNDGPTKANYFGLHMTHHGITIEEEEHFFANTIEYKRTLKDGYNVLKKPISVYDMTGRWKKVDKIKYIGENSCTTFCFNRKRFYISKEREIYVKSRNGRILWKKAKDLLESDEIMRFDGKEIIPTKVRLLAQCPETFVYSVFDFPGFRKKGFLLADGFIVRSYS